MWHLKVSQLSSEIIAFKTRGLKELKEEFAEFHNHFDRDFSQLNM